MRSHMLLFLVRGGGFCKYDVRYAQLNRHENSGRNETQEDTVRIYKRRTMRALLIQVVALVSGLPLFGASKKLAADIPTTGNVNVIIRYASPPDPPEKGRSAGSCREQP